jgi:hypothetical protein
MMVLQKTMELGISAFEAALSGILMFEQYRSAAAAQARCGVHV